MSAFSPIKTFAFSLVILCLVMGMNVGTVAQPPAKPKILFPKEDPIISEKFRQHLTKFDPQEEVKVWVFFTDKGFRSLQDYQKAVAQAEKNMTARAARRRSKTMKPDLIDFRDLPVDQTYIDRILTFQAKLRQRSRWLNAASFEVPKNELGKISQLSFVRSIKPVVSGKRKPIRIEKPPEEPPQGKGLFDLDYGDSYSQLQ